MDLADFISSEGEDTEEEQGRTPSSDVKKKASLSGFGRRLVAVASTVGGAIARSAEAAAETVQRGPKQIQAILQRVQHQIEQQRMAALLEEQRDAPVDVQVGFQLYEDSPQELRSRLWMALLEHPDLVGEYQALLAQQRANYPPASPAAAADADDKEPVTPASPTAAVPKEGHGDGASSSAEVTAVPEPNHPDPPAEPLRASTVPEGGDVGGDVGSLSTSERADAQLGEEEEDVQATPSRGPHTAPKVDPDAVVATEEGWEGEGLAVDAGVDEAPAAASGTVEVPKQQETVNAQASMVPDAGHVSCDAGHISPPPSHSGGSRATSPMGRLAAAMGLRRTPGGDSSSGIGNNSSRDSSRRDRDRSVEAAGSAEPGAGSEREEGHSHVGTPTSTQSRGSASGSGAEEWEVVDDGSGEGKQRQGQALLAASGSGRLMGAEGYSREQEAFRNKLMAAMMAVPWPLSSEYPEECRYSTLLQISVGQEEVDEVISRDIHRTFPEHPMFGFEQGQQALFRVLKAYSLHDIEVGYCQGMAFVAGLLLFYMNEEPAFQMFCRMLGAAGPNLRRLYLPGLEGLKAELRAFEFLMARHLPNLKAHLEACGVVPVLFASQWFLTAFSCPFPVHFACRLVDVMAVEGDSSIMLRTALTIMAECEADLFLLDDFEAIITYLKVEPVQWPLHRIRRVLDAAVHSAISKEDLAAAAAAVQEGYAGSLSRHSTSLEGLETEATGGTYFLPPAQDPEGASAMPSDPGAAAAAGPAALGPAMPAIATAPERALSSRRHSRGASLSQQALTSALAAAAPAAPPSRHGSLGAGLASGAGAEGSSGAQQAEQGAGAGQGDDLEAELAKHNRTLEEEYMAMVLALDMMWADSGDAASPAFDEVAGSRPPQQQ
ncbi:hypothetical protein N2152v2_001941 [Parachlorella kessleri]